MRTAIMLFFLASIAMLGCKGSDESTEDDFSELSEATEKAEHLPLHDQIFGGLFHAKINMRYHMMESVRWSRWDRWARIAAVVLGIASFSGPLLVNKGRWVKIGWYAVSFVALIVAFLPFVWPYGEWTSQDTILSGRWNQLANQWYALYEEQDDLEPKQARERIAELNKAAVEIENDETAARYDPEVMVAAENAEKDFQGIKKKQRSASTGSAIVR